MIGFIGFFHVGFQFRYFFSELPKPILYTTLNVKFLPFVTNITNFEKSSIVPVIFCCNGGSVCDSDLCDSTLLNLPKARTATGQSTFQYSAANGTGTGYQDRLENIHLLILLKTIFTIF